MLKIVITEPAKEDLDRLDEVDEDAAAEIEVALEEISNDQRLLEKLTKKKYKSLDTPEFEVDRFEELWQQGLNMLRLKFWDWEGSLLPYRVLYAYDPRKDVYFVLAVVERKNAYDTNHPILARVVTQYHELGIRTY